MQEIILSFTAIIKPADDAIINQTSVFILLHGRLISQIHTSHILLIDTNCVIFNILTLFIVLRMFEKASA